MPTSHLTGVSFQRTSIPTAITTISNAINGMNNALKYGGPTDNLAPVIASRISGYKVPSRIIEAATTSTRLLPSSRVSRDQRLKPTWLFYRSAQGEQRQRTTDHKQQEDQDKHAALRVGRKGVNRGQYAGTHQEGPQQTQ